MKKLFLITLFWCIIFIITCDNTEYYVFDDPIQKINLNDTSVDITLNCYFNSASLIISNLNTNYNPLFVSDLELQFELNNEDLTNITTSFSNVNSTSNTIPPYVKVPTSTAAAFIYNYSYDIHYSTLEAGDTINIEVNTLDLYFKSNNQTNLIEKIINRDYSFDVIEG